MRAATVLLLLGAGGCGAFFGADFDGWNAVSSPQGEDAASPSTSDADSGSSPGTDSGTVIKDCAGHAPPLERCGDRCVDLASDTMNCGTCGTVCTESGATCKAGACKVPVACDTTKIASDPSNCGACGHSCLGGTCVDGACQPVQLATLSSISSLAIDATHVYYTRDNALGSGVARVDKGGGNKKLLGSASNAGSLAVDGTYVYVAPSGVSTTGHVVARVPKIGGASSPFIPLEAGRFVGNILQADPTTLFLSYMGEQGRGAAVYNFQLANGTRTRLGATSAPNVQGVVVNAAITADATNVYLLSTDAAGTAVWRCPKTTVDGCVKVGPALSAIPESVAVYASIVFVTTKSSILSGSPGTVSRIDVATGALTTIASNRPHPLGIAADASGVYWAEFGSTATDEGSLVRADHAGTNMKTLTNGIGKPEQIVLDSVAIYAASYDSATQPNAIWKIAK
jgi:hypothetical protein